jgi:hypothetical protein
LSVAAAGADADAAGPFVAVVWAETSVPMPTTLVAPIHSAIVSGFTMTLLGDRPVQVPIPTEEPANRDEGAQALRRAG